MWTSRYHAIPETPTTPTKAVDPKQPYLSAVNQFSKRVPGLKALFNAFGHVRTLTTDGSGFLFDEPMLGTPAQQARKFLEVHEISSALALRHTDLSQPTSEEFALGHRVTFRQELNVDGVRYPVRHGYVHVFMDAEGRAFQLNSSLRYGRRNHINLDNVITEEQAIAAAKAKLGIECIKERAEFMFSSHNGKLDPVYEVVLTTVEPRRVALMVVKATSGEVVFQTNKLKASIRKGPKRNKVIKLDMPEGEDLAARTQQPASGTAPVVGKAFLRIPDPNTAISKQIQDVIIDTLPDPKVLKNSNLIMYVGNRRKEVRAKADGSYNFKPTEPEFAAVAVFFALNAQIELLKGWGMKVTRPIPVFVDDPSVVDNAYFDPENYEIHIGIGSGLSSGGLNRYVAFDLGVSWHEYGHCEVFLVTPGQDLPGSEGAGTHEAIGDANDLLMDWWFRHLYSKQLGAPLTVADVEADPRIIGLYAAPPNGIRIQKNKKQTPRDKTGEPHDDGLIIGGALADLEVAMVKQYGIPQGLELFGKAKVNALSLVPAHKVTFRDVLNAFVTADQRLSNGANRQMITQAFADHGIKLTARNKPGSGVPVIIIVQ